MTHRTTFVHLSDLHLSAAGTADPRLLADTEAALRLTFAQIARLPAPPAFVVVSGDLTDGGAPEDYAHAKALLEELAGPVPLVLALGNHDKPEAFRAAFGLPATGAEGRIGYDHDCVIGDLQILVLDSAVPGKVAGRLSAAQLDWLGARMVAEPDRRKLLVVHHSPLQDLERDYAWDRLDAASTEALRAAIAGHPVVGILSGHVHMEEVSHWHGVPVFIGAGHHAATDPLAPEDEIRLLDAAGWTLCTLRDSGLSGCFIPHPADRRELRRIPLAAIRAFDLPQEASA